MVVEGRGVGNNQQGKLMGLGETIKEGGGGNKTKERRNQKFSLLVGAKLIFLGEGGGAGGVNNMIHLHNI